MDFDGGGGIAGGLGYGNGYTGAANAAINNNNANYWANQNYVNQVGQYDPFAQSGGFGAQTDYYSGLGAAYGRAVGPQMTDNIYGVSGDLWSRMSPSDKAQFAAAIGGGGGGGAQPQPQPSGGGGGSFPAVDPTPDVGAGSPGGTPFGGGEGWGSAPQANASQPGSSGRNALAGLMWQGTNSDTSGTNLYGVDNGTWGRMSAGDKATFNAQMAQQGSQPSGGTSNAPPYQGNPFYPPAPMPSQPAIEQGGGFGAPGFGIGDTRYTGQPGFGLGIGGVGAPGGGANVGNVFGTSGQNPPFGGSNVFGYGGLTDADINNFPGGAAAYSRGGG